MRKIIPGLLLSGALLLGACGGPATTGTSATSTTAGTSSTSTTGAETSATSTTGAETSATSTTGAETSATSTTGAETSATSTTGAETSATSTTGAETSATSTTEGALNEAATAVSEAAGALSAVADDVTLQQGEALILDATQSAGNVADYKWTIVDAPAGAESVKGQVIREGSSGNVSLEPADYAQYFPTAGSYTVQLTVTDNAGQSSNTNFTIDVP
jgi:hypothetical protein